MKKDWILIKMEVYDKKNEISARNYKCCEDYSQQNTTILYPTSLKGC